MKIYTIKCFEAIRLFITSYTHCLTLVTLVCFPSDIMVTKQHYGIIRIFVLYRVYGDAGRKASFVTGQSPHGLFAPNLPVTSNINLLAYFSARVRGTVRHCYEDKP